MSSSDIFSPCEVCVLLLPYNNVAVAAHHVRNRFCLDVFKDVAYQCTDMFPVFEQDA